MDYPKTTNFLFINNNMKQLDNKYDDIDDETQREK